MQGLLEEDGGSPEAGPRWQKKMEFCLGELPKSRSEKVWACVCNYLPTLEASGKCELLRVAFHELSSRA